MEEEQERYMEQFEIRLQERAANRLAYADWRENRTQEIQEFVLEWNRAYSGEVAEIGGVRYELYRPGQEIDKPAAEGTTRIVTDYGLTPYDILNTEDGTLRTISNN